MSDSTHTSKKKPLWKRMFMLASLLFGLCIFCTVAAVIFAPATGKETASRGPTTSDAAPIQEAAAGDAGASSSTSAMSEEPAVIPTATPAPVGRSRESAVPLGESITTEDGWSFQVISLERDATARLQQINQFNSDPAPGMEWVIVRLQVSYNGDQDTGKLLGSEVRLTGNQGMIYSRGSVVLSEPLEGELFPEGTLQGELAFQVRQGEGNLILIVDTGPSSAWYLAAGEISLPIVAEAEPEPGATEVGKDRANPASSPALADNGMQLRVLEFVDDAGGRLKSLNQFNPDPAPGMKFVLVHVEGQYFGDKETFSDESFMWRLVGDKNAIYTQPTMVVVPQPYSGELFRYGTLNGWLAFEVPADESNWTLIYSGAGTQARYLAVATE